MASLAKRMAKGAPFFFFMRTLFGRRTRFFFFTGKVTVSPSLTFPPKKIISRAIKARDIIKFRRLFF
jgi:hypothetical protein